MSTNPFAEIMSRTATEDLPVMERVLMAQIPKAPFSGESWVGRNRQAMKQTIQSQVDYKRWACYMLGRVMRLGSWGCWT